MRRGMQAVCLGVLALLSPVLGLAATVHVSKSGSNSNSCSSAGGKQTIAAGIACLKGGDTLVLHAGTYTNEALLNLPGGSAGARTTVRTAGDGAVVLRSNTRSLDCLFCAGANYLTVDGGAQSVFVVAGTQRNDITIRGTRVTNARGQGFFVDRGERWLVDNNEIDHNGPPGSNFQHGMYFSANNSTISNSYLHHNACYNLQNYSSSGHPPRNSIIRGNIFTESGCGVTSQGSGHQILGNTFYGAAREEHAGGSALLIDGPNQTVAGNTFYCATIITIGGGDSGGVVRDNTFACPDKDLKLHTKAASLSNNRITRDTMAAPSGRPASSPQPAPEPPPAPRLH